MKSKQQHKWTMQPIKWFRLPCVFASDYNRPENKALDKKM